MKSKNIKDGLLRAIDPDSLSDKEWNELCGVDVNVRKKFSFNTIDDFDDHINKSIPNYNILFDSIKSISEYFFVDNTNVYDLGCSTGKLLNSIDTKCFKFGYDIANLLPLNGGSHNTQFENVDLNKNFDLFDACMVYSIFTMQFLHPMVREKYLNTIYQGLNKGGGFILCEKVYQDSGKMQEIFSFSHYDYKHKHFSSTDIYNKEKDLRHIMKPCIESDLMDMLNKVGFSHVSTFWQMFNFKGILAIK